MAARTTTTKEKQLKQPQANYNNTVDIQYYRNAITAKVRKKNESESENEDSNESNNEDYVDCKTILINGNNLVRKKVA